MILRSSTHLRTVDNFLAVSVPSSGDVVSPSGYSSVLLGRYHSRDPEFKDCFFTQSFPLELSTQSVPRCRGVEGREHVSVHAHHVAFCHLPLPRLDSFTPGQVMQHAAKSSNRLKNSFVVVAPGQTNPVRLYCCVLASTRKSESV